MTRVALAIIKKNNTILICRRKKDGYFGGKWEFPGGKIEAGETPEECLKRELLEELGITVRVRKFLTSIRHSYAHVSVELLVYLVDVESGIIQVHEHESVKWVSPSELHRYDFPDANSFILKSVAKDYL